MLSAIDSILKTGANDTLLGENIGICDTTEDGTFLIHYFLNANVKEKRPVCFVALTQSFKHFNSVSQKLGVGLQAARDTGSLDFVEGLTLLGHTIYEQTITPTENDSQEPPNTDYFSHVVKSRTLQPLLICLKNKINKLVEDRNCLPVVIIDNIGIFLNIGVSVTEVVTFLHNLNTCLFNSAGDQGQLVTLVTNTENDEQANTVWNYMCHSCSLTLQVNGLSSGYCKDVHGEMLVVWRDHYYDYRDQSTQKLQFKLTEKNISIFAVGMSTAVL